MFTAKSTIQKHNVFEKQLSPFLQLTAYQGVSARPFNMLPMFLKRTQVSQVIVSSVSKFTCPCDITRYLQCLEVVFFSVFLYTMVMVSCWRHEI